MRSSKLLGIIHDFFMNLKLHQKFIVGYIFIVFIPVVFFTSLLFFLNYRTAKMASQQSQEQEIHNFQAQFSSLLEQLSNYTYFFQNNTEIISYLEGEYTTVSDVMYYYVSSISDTFSCYNLDTRISAITIYGMKEEYVMEFPGKLQSFSAFTGDEELLTQIQKHFNGYWVWDDTGKLTFYKLLYDREYHFSLGILQIQTDLPSLLEQLTSQLTYSWYFRSTEDPSIVFSYTERNLQRCSSRQASELSNLPETLSVRLEGLSMELLQPFHYTYADGHLAVYLIVSVFSLAVFTCLYYFIVGSLTRRFEDFAHFINNQEAQNLVIYQCPAYKDEVGQTITAYNQLIRRVNQLIHNNYEVSLKMKEAQYYALQAQIKPHFLYNILENIRMSSESHGDTDTASMTSTFGKYMRYAMNTDSRPQALEKELESARDYLEVNKIRMGERLSYSISIQTELDGLTCPRFVLQTILENSIKHGWHPGKTLHISIIVTGENEEEFSHNVVIKIADDGIGIPEEKLKIIQDILYSPNTYPASRHVGLRNVNDRLKAFHPKGIGMSIESSYGSGTLIQIPLSRDLPFGAISAQS